MGYKNPVWHNGTAPSINDDRLNDLCYTVERLDFADGRVVVGQKEGETLGTNVTSEGTNTIASGANSHAEGGATVASGASSHAEGSGTNATGDYSHTENYNTTASGDYSHAEGWNTTAGGSDSHAEGYNTVASKGGSHAEGNGTTSSGAAAHAEGFSTTASGARSHSEGSNTTAEGPSSHAEGSSTQAIGESSHAEGYGTIASGNYQHVFGQHNISNANDVEIVGWGTSATPQNIRTLDQSGNMTIAGTLTQSSDAKLKTVEGEIPDVSEIHAVRFRWNDVNGQHDDLEHVGYIAQDVEKVAPFMVKEDSNGYKALDYIAFLCAKMELLERRVKELEEKKE